MGGRKIIEMSGQKFGQWTVINFCGLQGNVAIWTCKCSCGKKQPVRGSNLRNGQSTRCKTCAYLAMKCTKNTGELPDRIWNRIILNASSRNIPFELTRNEVYEIFLNQNRKCALTGLSIKFSETARKFKDTTASLDRIDSSKGYIEGNVWWVHKSINMMKQSMSVQDFKRFCKLVTDYV